MMFHGEVSGFNEWSIGVFNDLFIFSFVHVPTV